MFDPTIYSFQPLQVGGNCVQAEGEKPKSPPEIDNMHTIDSGVGAELLAHEKSLDEFPQLQSQSNDGTNEVEHNTAGTLSRKTSTTSDVYSSMSDYTPENTITSSTTSSPPTISTMQNVLPLDENTSSELSRPQPQLAQSESVTSASTDNSMATAGQSATSPDALSASESTAATPPSDSLNHQMAQVDSLIKDVEAAIISEKEVPRQPYRKISRFRVSPAILTADTHTPVVLPSITPTVSELIETAELPETIIAQPDLSLSLGAVNDAETLSGIPQPNHAVVQSPTAVLTIEQQVQYIGSSLANQPSAIYVVDPASGEGLPVDPNNALQQANAATTPQTAKPLGPEHINTLEQLKIGLENITHAHVVTKAKDPSAQDMTAGVAQYPTGQMQQPDAMGSVPANIVAGQANLIYSTRRASDDVIL